LHFDWQRYWAPRFWPTWLGIGFFWLLSRLPFRLVMRCGRTLGALMYLCLRSRRRISLTNLALAYPEMPTRERTHLARNAFAHLGMATAETAWIWYRSTQGMAQMDFEGSDYVDAALASGKGVILLQAHFTVLELCGAIVGARWPVNAVYDNPKNPLFAEYLLHQRSRHVVRMIENKSIRDMVRSLRRGEIVWYSPDQSVAIEHGGIATRYFGQPALSTTGTARIVTLTGAAVIPFIPTRHDNGARYTFAFGAPLNFDFSDAEKATQQVNDVLESAVRLQPEQYLWAHKRFKPPTPDSPNPYT